MRKKLPGELDEDPLLWSVQLFRGVSFKGRYVSPHVPVSWGLPLEIGWFRDVRMNLSGTPPQLLVKPRHAVDYINIPVLDRFVWYDHTWYQNVHLSTTPARDLPQLGCKFDPKLARMEDALANAAAAKLAGVWPPIPAGTGGAP